MSTPIPGYLKQKPDSPAPQPGDVNRYSVEKVEKRNKPGEFYNRVKNQGEGYGEPYKVLKAEQTGQPDNYGNLAYSVLLEAEDAGAVGATPTGAAPATSTDKDDQIARAVAFKGAVELAAAGEGNELPVDAVRRLTDELLPIVKGETAQPTPEAGPTEGGSPTNAADPDDNIPFSPSRF